MADEDVGGSLPPQQLFTVYLIHFTKPYRRAAHYIGVCREGRVAIRLSEHKSGRGARICRQAVQEGSELVLSRVWRGVPRQFERSLKKRGGARPFCPVCQGRSPEIE